MPMHFVGRARLLCCLSSGSIADRYADHALQSTSICGKHGMRQPAPMPAPLPRPHVIMPILPLTETACYTVQNITS